MVDKPIVLVVGARPNFVKAGPLIKLLKNRGIPTLLIHTGQHYDCELFKKFFEDFDLEKPDIDLGVGSGTHGEQTGKIMIELEKVLMKIKPSLVAVFGDVNSTIATALVTSKLHIPLAHIEAGLRSYDRRMPEEINRVLTDSIADYLFTPSEDACINLNSEGINGDKVHLVGNIMIDSLVKYLEKAKKGRCFQRFGMGKKKYWLMTLHRPSNVDIKDKFCDIIKAIDFIRKLRPVVFSIHPRTKKMIKKFELEKKFPWISGGDSFIPITPVGYIDFLSLEYYAEAVLTDSGGMQEETTYLNIPCLTVRENTERPITIKMGTNRLCRTGEEIKAEAENIFEGKYRKGKIPPLWDGHTAERIADILTAENAKHAEKQHNHVLPSHHPSKTLSHG